MLGCPRLRLLIRYQGLLGIGHAVSSLAVVQEICAHILCSQTVPFAVADLGVPSAVTHSMTRPGHDGHSALIRLPCIVSHLFQAHYGRYLRQGQVRWGRVKRGCLRTVATVTQPARRSAHGNPDERSGMPSPTADGRKEQHQQPIPSRAIIQPMSLIRGLIMLSRECGAHANMRGLHPLISSSFLAGSLI